MDLKNTKERHGFLYCALLSHSHSQIQHNKTALTGTRSKIKTTMASISQLNANGVALLHDGMCRDATVFFRQAIQCLAGLIQNDGGVVDNKNPNATAAAAGTVHGELYLNAVPVHGKINTFELSFSPGNNFAFFDKTFLLTNFPVNSHIESDETCQLQLTAVLLYNWGLSCHYAAMNIGKSKYLNRAMQLYTKAYHLLNHSDMVFNSSMTLLLLAINNNMGHISVHLADEAAARTFQDNLKCILSSSMCSDVDSSSSRSEYEFFFSTIILLDPCQPIMSRAPAA